MGADVVSPRLRRIVQIVSDVSHAPLASLRILDLACRQTYWGRDVFDHDPGSPKEERLKYRWRSLDNPKSFRITRRSLYNLLLASGFTTVYECHVPPKSASPPTG